jgi:hypothetical protein
MWYVQYMRALEIMDESIREASESRLARSAEAHVAPSSRVNFARRLAARAAVAVSVGAIRVAETLDCAAVSAGRTVQT